MQIIDPEEQIQKNILVVHAEVGTEFEGYLLRKINQKILFLSLNTFIAAFA